jgi:hypothetical protein
MSDVVESNDLDGFDLIAAVNTDGRSTFSRIIGDIDSALRHCRGLPIHCSDICPASNVIA